MKVIFVTGAAVGAAILVAQAQGEQSPAGQARVPAPAPKQLNWNEFERGFGSVAAPSLAVARTVAPAPSANVDVVDAHWMALTMWGEARGDGAAGMRAVGHVIDNRRRANAADPRFVTDTVSEAWQFSCWNGADPNRSAMLNIDALPRGGRDYRLWQLARQIAEEIMAGRSSDPTGGALFYHTIAVAPLWSAGITPIRRIGSHLFFRSVRRA
jgi:N-acetylmuramoyl-L-alanine amidase